MIAAVLRPDGCGEDLLQTGLADLGGDDEIVLEAGRSAGIFRYRKRVGIFRSPRRGGGRPSRMSRLKTACSAMELWPISKTMFRLEARAFSTSPRASVLQLVHRPGIPADPGVGGRDGFRSQVLSFGVLRGDLPDDLIVDVVSRENDFHRLLSPLPGLLSSQKSGSSSGTAGVRKLSFPPPRRCHYDRKRRRESMEFWRTVKIIDSAEKRMFHPHRFVVTWTESQRVTVHS